MQTLLIKKGLKCFNDITHLYRFHTFTILDDNLFSIPDEMNDHIFSKNDLEDSLPTDSFDEPQNQEVVSVLLPQRRSTFKLKKMNILKYLRKSATILNHLKTILASLMPVLISL